MNKSKSIFVTALMALMLAAILVGLYVLQPMAHKVLAALLALYGFIVGAGNFCQWLGKDTPLLPPTEPKTPVYETWEPDEEYAGTYDEIKAELEKDVQ